MRTKWESEKEKWGLKGRKAEETGSKKWGF